MSEPANTAPPPLHGVRVIDAASYLTGPFAAMQLADLGAEVIKVEPPKGDPFRRFGRPDGPLSAPFVSTNRGKRSVVLDLKQSRDVERLLGLLDDADVLLSNWRTGVAERLGLGDAELARRNPRLVRVYASGYGPDGPYATRPVYDSIIQVESGMAWSEGDDEEPRLMASWVVDKLTATFVAQSTLAALFDRQTTGVGQAVSVAMLDVMAYFNFPDHFANRAFPDRQPDDARYRQLRANRPIRATDGWLIIAPVTGDQIKRAVAAVGHPEWAAEVFAATDGASLTTLLLRLVESVTATLPLKDCLELFGAADVPSAPVLSPDQHLAHDQVVHNALYEVAEQPGLGAVRTVRHPARSTAWGPLRHRLPAPLLGEADSELLPD